MRDAGGINGRRSGRPRALAVVVALAAGLSGCWLQPGWGPSRSGHNPFEDELTVGNVATLSEAWSVTVGDGAVRDPAVSTDGVHTVAGRFVQTNGLSDGAARWSDEVLPPDEPGRPGHVGAPSVRDGQVLVPTSLYGSTDMGLEPDYGIFAYDAASGGDGDRIRTIGSDDSVTVTGDVLVTTDRFLYEFESGAEPVPVIYVSAEDLGDPSRSWSTVIRLEPGDERTASPAAVGRNRIVYSFDRDVEAFPRAHPTCDGEEPYVCFPEWTRGLAGEATPPVVSDDGMTVYVADTGGRVWALDAAYGDVRWTAALGGPAVPRFRVAPTVGGGRLYAPASDGRIYVFDADGCGGTTCQPRWAASTAGPVTKQAILAGGVLYVASGGTIDAYDAAGCGAVVCAPLWTGFAGGSITGGPVVAFGTLLAGRADGRLVAFRPA